MHRGKIGVANDGHCEHCGGVRITALEALFRQMFGDAEKRHDERYVNQKDYNALHNSLQRRMEDQAKDMLLIAKTEASAMGERIGISTRDYDKRLNALERWPWLIIGAFTVVATILSIVVGLLRK